MHVNFRSYIFFLINFYHIPLQYLLAFQLAQFDLNDLSLRMNIPCITVMMDNKPPNERPKLIRSERVTGETHLTSWEMFVKDSLLTLAWPDLLNDVPR